MTNFERLKSMAIDEFAEMLECIAESDVCLNPNFGWCDKCRFSSFCDVPVGSIKQWLKTEEESK